LTRRARRKISEGRRTCRSKKIGLDLFSPALSEVGNLEGLDEGCGGEKNLAEQGQTVEEGMQKHCTGGSLLRAEAGDEEKPTARRPFLTVPSQARTSRISWDSYSRRGLPATCTVLMLSRRSSSSGSPRLQRTRSRIKACAAFVNADSVSGLLVRLISLFSLSLSLSLSLSRSLFLVRSLARSL